VNNGVLLTAASRGQEFVLDCDDYPEAVGWLAELVRLVNHQLTTARFRRHKH